MTTAFTLVAIVIIASAFCAASAWIIGARPAIGFYLIAAVAVLNFEVPVWPPIVTVIGIQVTLPDLIVLALLSDTIGSRSGALKQTRLRVGVPVLLIALISASLVRGVQDFGFGVAVNDARSFIYILITSFWVYSLRDLLITTAPQTFRRPLIIAASLLLALAIGHVSAYGLGGAGSGVLDQYGITARGGRPITAAQAMFALIALIVVADRWLTTRARAAGALALLLAALIIVSQHRSVWAAALVAVATLLTLSRSRQRVQLAMTVLIGAIGTVAVLLLPASRTILTELSGSLSNRGTYDGRLFDWSVLIERNAQAGWSTLTFGQPFGAGWERIRPDGLVITYAPHNTYVLMLLRAGIIALVLFAAAVVLLVRRGLAVEREQRAMVVAVIVSTVIYMWAYNLQWFIAPFALAALYSAYQIVDNDEAQPKVNNHAAVIRQAMT